MTFEEYQNVLEAFDEIDTFPKHNIVTFLTAERAFRGRISEQVGLTAGSVVLMIEIVDAHDTSGAGSDFVAVPLSQIVAVYHSAQSHRYEQSKGL